jgi:hypothetical protein
MNIETVIGILCAVLGVEAIVGMVARRRVSGKLLLAAVALQAIPLLMFGWVRLMYPWESLNSDSTRAAGVLLMSFPWEMCLVPVGLLMLLICAVNTARQKRSPNQASEVTARKLAEPQG